MLLESRLASGFDGWCTTVSFGNDAALPDIWGDAFVDLTASVNDPEFQQFAGKLFYTRPGEINRKDATWLDEFELVARHADLIVSVPIDASSAPGASATIVELLHLDKHNLLAD